MDADPVLLICAVCHHWELGLRTGTRAGGGKPTAKAGKAPADWAGSFFEGIAGSAGSAQRTEQRSRRRLALRQFELGSRVMWPDEGSQVHRKRPGRTLLWHRGPGRDSAYSKRSELARTSSTFKGRAAGCFRPPAEALSREERQLLLRLGRCPVWIDSSNDQASPLSAHRIPPRVLPVWRPSIAAPTQDPVPATP